MSRRYFGTDGVRGKVGKSPITPDFVLRLGQAAGRTIRRRSGTSRPTVLIGKDTRISGYMLEAALEAGFSSAGVDVLLCGPIPTPAVAYLTRALRLDAGVVISASHNPYDDNGIKFFSGAGTKLPDEMELEMEEEMDRGFACVTSAELGKARRLDDASGRYIEFCKASISGNADLKGLKILVDCANGAAYHIAPSVFHELGAEVTAVGNTPDGFNINAGVGATHTEHLPELVREHGCDVAVSLDGDADRLIMADAHHVYNGDELLWAMVTDRLLDGAVSGVAGTLMTNFALEQKLAERQIPFGRAKVGDRYVLEMMKREGWLLGGETSGHIIALDKQTTGDGLVSALQVLAAMRRQEKTLAEVTAELTLLPQVLVNRPIEPGFDWRSSEAFGAAVREAEKTLEGRGRLLVRPSGTEPLLRIMVETADPAEARRLAEELAAALP